MREMPGFPLPAAQGDRCIARHPKDPRHQEQVTQDHQDLSHGLRADLGAQLLNKVDLPCRIHQITNQRVLPSQTILHHPKKLAIPCGSPAKH